MFLLLSFQLSLDSSPAPCTRPESQLQQAEAGTTQTPPHPPRTSSTPTQGAPVCHQDKNSWLYFMSLSQSRWELDVMVAQSHMILFSVHLTVLPIPSSSYGHSWAEPYSDSCSHGKLQTHWQILKFCIFFSNPKLLTSNSSLHKNIFMPCLQNGIYKYNPVLMKRPGRNSKYTLNKFFWMTEWRESLTHSVSAPSTMPQRANPGIRRGKTPFSACKKRPIADCSKSCRSLTTTVKTAKKSTSSTTGQMKGCIRHVILVFNSKTPIPYWASAAHKVSDPLNMAHFILTWTSQLRLCP